MSEYYNATTESKAVEIELRAVRTVAVSRAACPHVDVGKRIAPESTPNLAKHLTFTRCGELNFNDVIEAQIESELLADDTLVS